MRVRDVRRVDLAAADVGNVTTIIRADAERDMRYRRRTIPKSLQPPFRCIRDLRRRYKSRRSEKSRAIEPILVTRSAKIEHDDAVGIFVALRATLVVQFRWVERRDVAARRCAGWKCGIV